MNQLKFSNSFQFSSKFISKKAKINFPFIFIFTFYFHFFALILFHLLIRPNAIYNFDKFSSINDVSFIFICFANGMRRTCFSLPMIFNVYRAMQFCRIFIIISIYNTHKAKAQFHKFILLLYFYFSVLLGPLVLQEKEEVEEMEKGKKSNGSHFI